MAVNVINNIKQQVIVDFDKYLNRLYIGHQDNYDNILHKIAFIQTALYRKSRTNIWILNNSLICHQLQKRYACLSDLLGYFKKTDLLSGLTNLEKKQVRYNIGVSEYLGEGGQTIPISIIWWIIWFGYS